MLALLLLFCSIPKLTNDHAIEVKAALREIKQHPTKRTASALHSAKLSLQICAKASHKSFNC